MDFTTTNFLNDLDPNLCHVKRDVLEFTALLLFKWTPFITVKYIPLIQLPKYWKHELVYLK